MAGIKSISVTSAGVGYTSVGVVQIASGFLTNLRVLNDGADGAGRFIEDNHTSGMARGSSGTSITLATTASADTGYYVDAFIYIESGTGAGQVREITAYNGTTKAATVLAWTTQPDITSRYEIGPKIAFSGGGGSGASAFAYIRNGTIQQVIFPQGDEAVTNLRGEGYTTPPTVTLTDSEGSIAAQSSPSYSAELEAWIDTGGGATAEVKLTGTSIASVAVAGSAVARSEGSAATAKYSVVPSIVVTPGNDDIPTTPAVLTPVLTATSLGRITVTNAGTGLNNGAGQAITVSGSATATANVSGGSITEVNITGAGSGYTEPPGLDFSSLGGSGVVAAASLTPTTIASVTVTNGGAGFTAVPTLTVIPQDPFCDQYGASVIPASVHSQGTGTYVATSSTSKLSNDCGAAEVLTATLTATTVGSIQITSPGAGYGTPPPIIFGSAGSTKAAGIATLNNTNKNAIVTRNGLEMLRITRGAAPNTKSAGSSLEQGGRVPQKLKTGQLVMTKEGLHRVTGVEALSIVTPIGLEAELVSHTAPNTNDFVIKLVEKDPLLGNAFDSITIPAGTELIFGGQRAGVRETAKTTGDVTLSNKQGTFTISEAMTQDIFTAGDEIRIQFIPGHAGVEAAGTQSLLNKFTLGELDPESTGNKQVIYHVGVGLNYTPKFIAADGTFAKAGRSSQLTELNQSNTGAVENGPKDRDLGGALTDATGGLPDNNVSGGFGLNYDIPRVTRGKMQKTFIGYTSARLRVFQPKGVPKFAAQMVSFRDDVGMVGNDALMINKTGFITANESPAIAPNPIYMFWVGVGEENLPEFQVAGNDEDIIDPIMNLIGHKYSLRPVPDAEAKRMTRRSGGFKYEVIPHALDAYKKQGLGQGTAGPAGPAEGWSVHVKNHKGTPMNKQEFDNATNQQTPQTEVILNGTSRRRNNQRRDPRLAHRRDY